MASIWRLRLKTAVKYGQRWRWGTRLRFDAKHGADIGKDHACWLDDTHQNRQEHWHLRRHVVGALGIGLAVTQTECTVVTALITPALRHIGARFGQSCLRVATCHLVSAAGTGVRRRCQLDCQENDKEDAG